MDERLAQMEEQRCLGAAAPDWKRRLPLKDAGTFPGLQHGVDRPSIHRCRVVVEFDIRRTSAPVLSVGDLDVLEVSGDDMGYRRSNGPRRTRRSRVELIDRYRIDESGHHDCGTSVKIDDTHPVHDTDGAGGPTRSP